MENVGYDFTLLSGESFDLVLVWDEEDPEGRRRRG